MDEDFERINKLNLQNEMKEIENKEKIEKQENEKKDRITKEEAEINKDWAKFLQYLRVSSIIGILYGMGFGWMWGWKGFLFYGPLIGCTVGVIMAVIFTFDKRNKNIDRDQYL